MKATVQPQDLVAPDFDRPAAAAGPNGMEPLGSGGAPALWFRHACHFAPLALLTAAAAILALPADLAQAGPLRILYAGLVALNVWPLAMASWGGALGAAVGAWRAFGGRLSGPLLRAPTGTARTAVLLPVHEEDPIRIAAAVAAMAGSLALERAGTVAIFVLSDTGSPSGARAEEDALARLLTARPAGGPAIHYRRRADRSGRKAGNVADFCARWGADYDFMIVLDADSLMTGAAMAHLIGTMEANPRAALIQGMCYPVGRDTLFARVQQFSAWFHGPLFARGNAFWQGSRGSYWGHNAILRVAAFAAHCGLPVLPGRPPLGGEILSHDTVEAALLLRAGWDVWTLPDGEGGATPESWEEVPTNLLDHLKRERRWCQGNLQHAAVLGAEGLRPASLYHLGNGILHYLSAPLFLLWLALHAWLGGPATEAGDAALGAFVGALVFLPRLLCLAVTLADGATAARFGGRLALTASAILEQVFACLLFPVALVFNAIFVAGTLTGQAVRWDAQVRSDRGVGIGEASARLAGPLAAGLLLLGLIAVRVPLAAALLAPGLVLGVPLAVWSSRRAPGGWGRLFATPEDTAPHPIRRAMAGFEERLRQPVPLMPPPLPPLPRENGMPLTTQVLRQPRRSLPPCASASDEASA